MSQPSYTVSGMPSAQPLGSNLGQLMPVSSIPQYTTPFMPPRYNFFKPTVTPDSAAELQHQGPIRLSDITPRSLSPGVRLSPQQEAALQVKLSDRGGGRPAGHGSADTAAGLPTGTGGPAGKLAASADRRARTVESLAKIRTGQIAQEADECLARAIQAVRSANYRSTAKEPGAIALYRQAIILAPDRSEPVVGLMASLVAVGDYYEAASLLRPLVQQWPNLLARSDLFDLYGTHEEMRSRLVLIRQAMRPRGDMDLELLIAFYRWYFESRQQASNAVSQMAAMSPSDDSTAKVMETAMRRAMTTSGS